MRGTFREIYLVTCHFTGNKQNTDSRNKILLLEKQTKFTFM